MSYGSMPSDPTGYSAGSASKGDAPSVVKNAVLLMYARIVLGIVSVIVIFVQRDEIRKAVRKADTSLSSSEVDSAVNVALTITIVLAVVFLVLYVLLAMQVGRGKNWARVVTWVLAGLGVVGAISGLASSAATGLSRTLGVIGGLIDLAIIVLLIMANKTGYFRR